MSLDTFSYFRAIELVTHRLISKGGNKDDVISQTVYMTQMWFSTGISYQKSRRGTSLEILREVIELWFTIRGFSVAICSFLKIIREHLN